MLAPGLGASIQDQGRLGWRRFGVPASGPMDDHSAAWANRLLDNPLRAPVLELLWQGGRLEVLEDLWLAVTGADVQATVPTWRTVHVKAGQVLDFPLVRTGLWIYLAVEGGFHAPRLLGSASAYPRGRLGSAIHVGDILCKTDSAPFGLLPGVAGRTVPWNERRDHASPPALRLWPAPQWNWFSEAERAMFFRQEWTITSQSDRVGYRLAGVALKPDTAQVVSEPVRVGSVQVPENGQPIVTMRDGPTVGGYPKLGLLDSDDLSWLAQCRPGQTVRFEPVL